MSNQNKLSPVEILEALKGLSPEETNKLLEGLQPKSKRKQSRKKKGNEADKQTPQIIIPGDEPSGRKQGRATTRQSDSGKPSVLMPGERTGRKNGRTVSMPSERPDINEVNIFDPNEYAETAKSDTEWQKAIDPIYKGKAKPTERRDDFRYADGQCRRCNRNFQVPAQFLNFDPDKKIWSFICDDCRMPRG